MSLGELRIENLRCIESAALEFSPELNLIAGENGAGKTSVLEAIFLLGRGRSFRTRTTERLIRLGQGALTVFGRTQDLPPRAAGIQVSREGTRARVNGENVQSLLQLSGVLPVQAIDPDIHKLIEHGPERRRRWLDWLVFHVEPTFASQWTKYQRVLKQRNAALKAGSPDITNWDAGFVEAGEAISKAREHAIQRLTLQEQLRANLERDRERGLTHSGPHRADVDLRIKGRIAREVLSRGQQKLTAVAMIVSQLQLLRAELDMQATLLLDDPAAELDARNLRRLFDELSSLKCQMIATSLTPETALFQAPKATFHVEQGRVMQV